jgi:hypothetical protein
MEGVMGFESGLLIAGALILGVVASIVLGLLWSAGQALTALPKGVSLRDLAVIALIAALGAGVSKGLAALEVVSEALARAVVVEAVLLLAASGVAWLFTNEA